MCHGFDAYDWSEETAREADEGDTDDPSFLNDEPSEETTVLTDGGEDDE